LLSPSRRIYGGERATHFRAETRQRHLEEEPAGPYACRLLPHPAHERRVPIADQQTPPDDMNARLRRLAGYAPTEPADAQEAERADSEGEEQVSASRAMSRLIRRAAGR
jgi:hypothetical protein